jgi:protein arginine kinase
VAGRPFCSRLRPDERQDLEAHLKAAILKALDARGATWFELADMPEIDRRCLVERHLISRELAAGDGQRGVAIDAAQQVAVMANEEDHIRLQVIFCGLQLQEAWQEADSIDNRLEEHLTYAYSPTLGYLTACPTNVGTGMRASVMLHLPSLVLTKQIEKVFRAVARMRLVVRGLYGEGTQATGDIYQISNQASLGRSEAEILKTLGAVITQIIAYEQQARDVLAGESPAALDDRVFRAWGLLTHARIISSEETLTLLSAVRLGVHMGRLKGIDIGTVNDLFLLTRPGHIQKIRGAALSESERDAARADYIRSRLGAT